MVTVDFGCLLIIVLFLNR